MSDRKAFVVIALAVSLLACGAAARVAHADEPTDADRAAAQDAFAAGMEARARGNHLEALPYFHAALEHVPSPITALEYGRELASVGHLVEARDRFLLATKLEKAGESEAARSARVQAAELAKRIEPRIPHVVVEITGASDAAVTIDGEALSSDGIGTPRAVDPGKHELSAVSHGTTNIRTISLREGETKTVTFVFGATGGTSRDDSIGGAHAPLWAYGALAVGGLGIGVSAIEGIVAFSKKSSLHCANSRCPGASGSDINSLDSAMTVSSVAFVIGAVGGGIGIYGLLSSGDATSSTATSTSATRAAVIEPYVGLGSIGLAGAF